LAIHAVVSLEGAALETEPLRELDNRVCGSDVIDSLLGGTPEEVPDHYAAGALEELLPFGVPVYLLTGGDDPMIPPRQVEAFAEVVRAKGDKVTITAIDGSGHFDLVVPGTSSWSEVRSTLLSLFNALSPPQPH
jgi:acetyl esterase/lipase